MAAVRWVTVRWAPLLLLGVLAAGAAAAACSGDAASLPAAAPGTDAEDLGADSTATLLRGRPYHQDGRALTTDEQRRFAAGAEVFQHPVRRTASDGSRAPFSPLPGDEPTEEVTGPLFVETACMTCHVDGLGPDVTAPGPGVVVRVAAAAGAAEGEAHPTIGHQIQDEVVEGTGSAGEGTGSAGEGELQLEWETLSGRYGDGTGYELRRPLPSVTGDLVERGGPAAVSLRVAPPLLGLGLLEAVPAETLEELADPGDADGDGISGRVARGRFGWKAAQPTVRSQTVAALSHDMGVTTGQAPDPCDDRPVGCDEERDEVPELWGEPFDDLLLYTEAIAVPRARDLDRPPARRGAQVFTDLGCSSCHTPTLRTGDSHVAAHVDRTIHPYTDLLLHDLGDGLDDGVGEPGAAPDEWRTAPLWGIGLRDEVYGGGHYLHDGRAATLEEAILWHGGEAAAARDGFARAEESDRADLLAFLRSL